LKRVAAFAGALERAAGRGASPDFVHDAARRALRVTGWVDHVHPQMKGAGAAQFNRTREAGRDARRKLSDLSGLEPVGT
jgi:hypothetical protein